MVRLPVKAPVNKGIANPHIALMRVMADKVRPQGRRTIKAGASYYVTADGKIMTHIRLLDRQAVKKIGSLIIAARPSEGAVTIEHNLRPGGIPDAVSKREANEVEDVVREHFSPLAIKFIRK